MTPGPDRRGLWRASFIRLAIAASLLPFAFAPSLAQDAAAPDAAAAEAQSEPVQLRLTNTLPDKVDYYLALPGAKPVFVGSVPAKTAIDVESRKGQAWRFAVKRVPFQAYTVRGELFQNLTLAPKGQQKPPRVAAGYQPPVGAEPPVLPGGAKAKTATVKQATPAPDPTAEDVASAEPKSGIAGGSAAADGDATGLFAENETAVADGGEPTPTGDGLIWFHETFKDSATGLETAQLVFGVPQTDNIQVTATCSAETGGAARVILGADVGRLKPGAAAKARFVGRDFDRTLGGVVLRDASGEGQQGADLKVTTDDPLWAAFVKLQKVDYTVGGTPRLTLPLKGSRKPITAFLDACDGFAGGTAVAEAPAKATKAATASKAKTVKPAPDSCKTMAGVVSKPGGKPLDVTFVNKTKEYRFVNWIDQDGGVIQYVGLNAGETFDVTTDSRHPWMATDGPGNCIEILMPREGQTQIAITRPSPGFGPE